MNIRDILFALGLVLVGIGIIFTEAPVATKFTGIGMLVFIAGMIKGIQGE